MRRVCWTPSAGSDLVELAHWIGVVNHRPLAADRFVDRIRMTCDRYAAAPELGELRNDLGEEIRLFPVGDYIVVYRPVSMGIEVIRVIHGSRDYPALFH